MAARRRERGQILVLFVLVLVAILAMTALLFDGAYAYVQRRKLQDAGDAAALAAVNFIGESPDEGCSSTFGPPPGPPRASVLNAALASIALNLPGFSTANVTVTCPSGWSNVGVRVALRQGGTNYFGQMIGAGPLDVATTSSAVNGRTTGTIFTVVLLNPWQPTWPQGRRGCPSLLFSGGPTVVFDGAVQVDSACPSAYNGALGTNGNAATVTLNNGAQIKIVGGYNPAALTITPTPLTGQPYFPDPLAHLQPVPVGDLTERSDAKLILNNETRILEPGVYRGGIELRNTSIALLRPGIYVLDGGGLKVGAQASFCSIVGDPTVTPADCTTWSSVCADTDCGILLFNRGTQSVGSGAMGEVSVSAGSTVQLKAYDERAMGGAYPEYRNLLIWQDASPAASGSYAQPVVHLNGGGIFNISGTLYAPQALVEMGGTSGGAGGGAVDLTLQFVVWDLEIRGNASFRFRYNSADFAVPKAYGLVE